MNVLKIKKTTSVVSIVIPSYLRPNPLLSTIRAVMKEKKYFDELIIVDQKGKLKQKINKEYKNHPVFYFAPQKNGPSFARNFALKKVKGTIVIYIDDDIIPHSHFIKPHIAAFQDKHVMAVAGRVQTKRKNLKKLSKKTAVGKMSRFGAKFDMNFDSLVKQEVDFGLGAHMSFRTSLLKTIGGFDERFDGGPGFEELDVFLTLKEKIGGKVLFEPATTITHLLYPTGGTRIQDTVERTKKYYISFGLFIRKHIKVYFLPFFLFFQIPTFFRSNIFVSLPSFFKGYLQKN